MLCLSGFELYSRWVPLNMSEQVGSVTRKKSSDFYGGIRFQSEFYNQMGT